MIRRESNPVSRSSKNKCRIREEMGACVMGKDGLVMGRVK